MAKKETKEELNDLLELKNLLKTMKKFNKTESGLELSRKECHAISDYVDKLELRAASLEAKTAELKREAEKLKADLAAKSTPKTVIPCRNDRGYYPVCPECGKDLGNKIGDKYCDCGARLVWLSI